MGDRFRKSDYIWAAGEGPSRNCFVSFIRDFTCTDVGVVWLHLFADTRYRLWVNGEFIAHGPARFVTCTPEYDSFDISDWLKRGENRVRVEVNYYGSSSYQSMPDSLPGFIAAGGSEDGRLDLATPGEWQCVVHHAWNAESAKFSFAQNPCEICDTNVLSRELAGPLSPVRPLSPEECPWGALRERSVGYPDYHLLHPAELCVAGPLTVDKSIYGFQSVSWKESERRFWRSFSTWLWTPHAQLVTIDCFWSDLFLNGEQQVIDQQTMPGNHAQVKMSLQAGWNSIVGHVQLLSSVWSYMLGIPAGAELSLHALPDHGCTERFALSPIGVCAESDYVSPEKYRLPADWTLNDGDPDGLTPARVFAWDTLDEEHLVRHIDARCIDEVNTFEAKSAAWCFRFDTEFFGHAIIDVDAPEGSILDVAYDDWLREDGCVNLYGSNPFVDSVDRFFLRGGRQMIEVFNPRGGRFLQITLRGPADADALTLTLRAVAIKQRTTIHEQAGAFSSGHTTLDWTWQTSIKTLKAATDEGYTDCPWRERADYIGDSVVDIALHALISTDLRVARRVLRNFGNAAMPDGQLACSAPSWLRKPHEDFSMLWVLGLRKYWARTGDLSLADEMWPRLESLWRSSAWVSDETGLWSANDKRLFIDWGVVCEDRIGAGNATLNILRVAAARAAAELAGLTGRGEQSEAFLREAEQVEAALMEHLWLESEGRFATSRDCASVGLHANVLALRFGLGDARRILSYLEPLLHENISRGLNRQPGQPHLELYFLFHLLPALAENGREDLAESVIENHYGYVKGLGYPTLVECFHRAAVNAGSSCHAWSGAGAVYATRYVLGLRQEEPGNLDAWVLDPRVTDKFDAVHGVQPHPRGSIEVQWVREQDRICAQIMAPEGVSVRAQGRVKLSQEPAPVLHT